MKKETILGFIATLGNKKEMEEVVESISSISKVVSEIFDIDQKSLKEKKRRYEDEKKDAKKKERNERRTAADIAREERKVQKRIKKAEKKEETLFDKLLKFGAIGLGVGGLGALGFAFKDEIKEAIDGIVRDIKDKIAEELKKIADELGKWAQKQLSQFGTELLNFLGKPVKAVVETAQDWRGGQGTTESGIQFGYSDVVSFAREQESFLRDNGVTGEGADQQLEKYNELQRAMFTQKNLNDRLYSARLRLSRLEGATGRDARNKEERLVKLRKEIAKLENDKIYAQGRVTELWGNLGITDQKLLERQGVEQNQRQRGGTINAANDPTKGDMLARRPNSTQLADFSGLKLQNGGAVKSATKILMKDEALSSLSRGSNDYVKPGGRSVVSRTPWESVNPNTSIHAYRDSVGQPTIGWGSTYYDNIMSGKDPVRMGDTITKKRADVVLTNNVAGLAQTYSKKMRYWKRMSDQQKAGLLSLGYNAPNAPIGSYRNLTAALNRGDMVGAANNIQRRGPNAARIAEERRLILSGPKDLTQVKEPTKAPVKAVAPQQNPLQQFANWISQPFRRQKGGVIGKNPNSYAMRLSEANSGFMSNGGGIPSRPVVVVKRQPQMPPVEPAAAPGVSGGGSDGINMVDAASALHRIQSGAKF